MKIVLTVALCWCVLLAWQVAAHRAEARRHRETLARSGEASIAMLEAALRSIGRGRRQRPEFLTGVFDGVLSVPGIRGTWLAAPDGTTIFEKADRELTLPEPSSFSGRLWDDGGLLVGRRANIGACPFDGQGRPRPPETVDEPLYLFLFLDASDVELEVTADLRLRAVIQAVATLAAVGIYAIARARLRARRLRRELDVADERARRHREWAVLGAGLAHETKNPLSVIRGLAQGLVEDESDATGRAQSIVDEVDRVVARINEFLNYSRPIEPRHQTVPLRPLLDEMAGLVEPDLAPSDGRVEVAADGVAVRADPGMLRQILLNLLVNAARAIRRHGVIRVAALRNRRGSVTLEVRDDGAGIPPADIDRVFEPYFTRRRGGIGLGLAIVRRLVEAHGWSIELESSPGEGTTVRISGLQEHAP